MKSKSGFKMLSRCIQHFKTMLFNQITLHLWLPWTVQWVRIAIFLMKQKWTNNAVHCVTCRIKERFCEHFVLEYGHRGTHIHRVYVCALSPGLQYNTYFLLEVMVKKVWKPLVNTRPTPELTLQKIRREKTRKRKRRERRPPSKLKQALKLPRPRSPGGRGVPVLAIPPGPLAGAPHHGGPGAAASGRRVLGMRSRPDVRTVRQRRVLGHGIWGRKE